MTFDHRSITTETLDWHGFFVQVTFERQRFVDHIQIETLEPQRAPLPITETGYRSHFIAKGIVEDAGGPSAYVLAWLNDSATGKGWYEIEAGLRQLSLF